MTNPVHPATRIGHVHLKVADLDRAIAFYSGVLGFEVTQKYGRQAAFLSAVAQGDSRISRCHNGVGLCRSLRADASAPGRRVYGNPHDAPPAGDMMGFEWAAEAAPLTRNRPTPSPPP